MTNRLQAQKRLIFVGPDPAAAAQHPGGQLTAARGIAEYAQRQGYAFEVIDTLTASFPPPGAGQRLRSGLRRAVQFLGKLIGGDVAGVILFVGARFSFVERALLAGLARAFGVRTVFCIRDGGFYLWMRSSPAVWRLVRTLLRLPNVVVVQGTKFEAALMEAGVPASRLVVVRNWLPETHTIATKAVAAVDGVPLRAVFVGWLVQDKGVRELLDAFQSLASRHQFALDVIGGGTLEKELRAQIAAAPMPGLQLHGWKSAEEVRGFLEAAQIFVLPTYYEGFPNALLEAMALGLPSVCADVGAISDSLQSGVNGFLVPPKNAAALADALEQYIMRPELIARHSAATLIRVRELHDRDGNLARLFACL